MKIEQRLLSSLFFSIIVFTVLISLFFTDLLPVYSNFIGNVFLSMPKLIFALILFSAFVFLFLILLALFSIKSKKGKIIKARIQELSETLFNELLQKLPSMSLVEVKKQLKYTKIQYAGELKMQFCKKSLKYIDFIDETLETKWLQLESLLEAEKRVELESDEAESDEELLSEVDETVLNSIQNGIEQQNAILPEDNLEELEQTETVNPLEIIEDLEVVDQASLEEEINLLDELEAANEEPELEVAALEELEELEELDEYEELEELEVIDDLEELKSKDPYPELLNMLNKRPIYLATSNKTFISAETDNFATVDNIFAEDLCLGTEYTRSYAPFDEDFAFVPVKLDFQVSSEAGELLPVQKDDFAMTDFCAEKKLISDLTSDSDDTIIEKDGVYTISENISYKQDVQDSALKALIDSILK